jgi:hypothetical protein
MGTADLEVAGMTAGAIRLVGGCAPADDRAVGAMTIVAVEVGPVVTGIGGTGVVEVCWEPALRAMTSVAG